MPIWPTSLVVLSWLMAFLILFMAYPGKKFQTPFARPWSKGQSPPVVNVIWRAANFVIGYVLVFKVGHFEGGFTLSALMVGLGAFVIVVMLALSFGRVREH